MNTPNNVYVYIQLDHHQLCFRMKECRIWYPFTIQQYYCVSHKDPKKHNEWILPTKKINNWWIDMTNNETQLIIDGRKLRDANKWKVKIK